MTNIVSEYKSNHGLTPSLDDDRISNHKINKLHEQALRIACDDYHSSIEELMNMGWVCYNSPI